MQGVVRERTQVRGKLCDYVFYVDFGDGKPARTLGLAADSNEYVAVQEFIDEFSLEGVDNDFLEPFVTYACAGRDAIEEAVRLL